MFENEKQFEELINKMDLDDSVDAGHKGRLKSKMLKTQKTRSKFLFVKMLVGVAAAVLVGFVVGRIAFYRQGPVVNSRNVAVMQDTKVENKIAIMDAPIDAIKVGGADTLLMYRRKKSESKFEITKTEIVKTLDSIEALAEAKDVEGLTTILRGDDKTAKLFAAKYLAKILDSDPAIILKASMGLVNTNDSNNPFNKTFASVVVGGRIAEPNVVAEVNEPTGPFTLIVCRDKKSEKPIAGVMIGYRYRGGEENRVISDVNGLCRVIHPNGKIVFFNIYATANGYVPMSMIRHQGEFGDNVLLGKIDFEMSKAVEVGGEVVSSDGEPVEGAVVRISAGSYVQGLPNFDLNNEEIKTDSDGQWICENFPADAYTANVSAEHDDFVKTNMSISASVDQLKDFTYVYTLQKGKVVSGRVLDLQQMPIAGAKVLVGNEAWNDKNYADTDEDGYFEFKNCPDTATVFTATANGYGPAMIEADDVNNGEPLIFNLEPACIISGQIVDVDGNPVQGVSFNLDKWNGYRTLSVHFSTDAEGRFGWADAPADEVVFQYGKEGYLRTRDFKMSCGNDYKLIILPAMTVSGHVYDADTKQQIDKFSIKRGYWQKNSNQVNWQNYRAVDEFTGGTYEISSQEPWDLQLKVTADGYAESVSEVFAWDEGSAVYDFYLEKSEGVLGKVLSPDGKGVEAMVIMPTPLAYAYLKNGRFTYRQNSIYTETDANGVFKFNLPDANYILVAFNNDGFAKISKEEFADSNLITLQKWGRIEGSLTMEGEPADGEYINIDYRQYYDWEPNTPRFGASYETVTDSNGNFVIERVVPGPAVVSRTLKENGRRTLTSHRTYIDVEAGQTAIAEMGVNGLKIKGRFVKPLGAGSELKWQNGHAYISTRHHDFEMAVDYESMSWQQKYEYLNQYRKKQMDTDARKDTKTYQIIIDSNGVFEATDVAAGKYRMNVTIYNRNMYMMGSGKSLKQIAFLPKTTITVPEKGESSSGIFDVGSFNLEGSSVLKKGDVLPRIPLQMLDDTRMSTDDFRGKYLVIHFGHINSYGQGDKSYGFDISPEIFAKFADRDDVQFLTLIMVCDPADVKEVIAEHNVTWPIAIMDGGIEDLYRNFWQMFGISEMNSVFIFAPDGKLINSGSKEIEDILDDALVPLGT